MTKYLKGVLSENTWIINNKAEFIQQLLFALAPSPYSAINVDISPRSALSWLEYALVR